MKLRTKTLQVAQLHVLRYKWHQSLFLYGYTTLLIVLSNFLLIKLGGKCLWVALISCLSHKLFL